jgi:hypothetical protein
MGGMMIDTRRGRATRLGTCFLYRTLFWSPIVAASAIHVCPLSQDRTQKRKASA